MKIRIAILSLVISAITVLIATQCVYRTVERLRFKLMPQPAPAAIDGTAALRYVNPRPADAKILAVRIKNNSDQDQVFTVRQNSIGITSFTTKKNFAARYTFQIPEAARCSRCRLTIIGQNSNWELQTVEVRNVFGFSSAWFKAVLTETSFHNYTKLKPLELALIFLLTFLITMQMLSANASRKQLIPAAFAIVFSAAVFANQYITGFKVLLSTTAFAKLWLLSFLPFWMTAYRRLREKPNFKPILAALIVGLTFTGGMLSKLDDYDGNFSGFLHISKKFLGRNQILFEHPEIRRELIKVDWNGYDGQFFYFMAFDPLLRQYHITANTSERPIDVPVFRYRRIAYPLLTKLFALNNPFYYPAAMMFIIIAGAAVCGFYLSKAAVYKNLSGWEGLVCILIPAFWFSLSVATPEALAAGFLAAGFFLTLKKRYLIAAIIFSLAILTRESSALFVLILAVFEFKKSKLVKSALMLVSALVPYFAWRSYIAIALLNVDGWKGFFMEPANLGLPFAGIIQTYSMISTGAYPEAIRLQAFTLPIILLILLGVCLFIYIRTKNPAGLIGAVYAFLALSLSYNKVWMDVSNVERQSYECFLCLGFLFSTRPQGNKSNLAIYAALAVILIYDLFIMIRSDAFKSGLLWLLKC